MTRTRMNSDTAVDENNNEVASILKFERQIHICGKLAETGGGLQRLRIECLLSHGMTRALPDNGLSALALSVKSLSPTVGS